MARRLFELHLGVDKNEATGDIDYVVSGKVSKEAQESFLGGCLFNMLGTLDKQTKEYNKTIEVVENIPVVENKTAQELAAKWKK